MGSNGASGCAGISGVSYGGKEVKTEEEFLNIKRKERLKDILDDGLGT